MDPRAFIKAVAGALFVVPLIAYAQRVRLRPTSTMALSVRDGK